MNPNSSRNRLFLIGGCILMAVALFFGWQWAGQDSAKPAPKKTTPTVTKAEPIKSPDAPSQTPAPAMAAGGDKLTTVEEGDLMIDQILRSEKEIPAMARDLHDLVKKLNSEAQVNASRHLVNLTSDEDYGLIAGYLVDAKMNPDVIEVLFSDLMNRKRELQLPLFMNILKNPQHPQNEQVRNVMTILAGEDFAQDFTAWDKWSAAEIKKAQTGE
ncbi:MAG: hypothetical protein NTV80_04295 [Verrucomicrobia bacterium]|nr:hypothetical protein [Verrucomicrobiota bacterium]